MLPVGRIDTGSWDDLRSTSLEFDRTTGSSANGGWTVHV
jgi:hypothetical protein